MSKLEDAIVNSIAWIMVGPLVVLSAIGGFFIWLGAKIGIIRK